MGPKLAEVATRLGKPPMPHQRAIYDVAGEIDPATGALAYGEIVVIGPRQGTGKTELLLPAMTHRCHGFGAELHEWVWRELGIRLAPAQPQSVLYLAQSTEDGRKKWRDVHVKRLEASAFYRPVPEFTTRLARNQETIFWGNGSVWSPGSIVAGAAGTGDTLDMGVLDEAWSRPDFRTELGLRPAMSTRWWSQLWIASMIPGPSRKKIGEWRYLKAKRDLGQARVRAGSNTGMAFFDFAAPPGSDPEDPDTWYQAIPGLGYTVPHRKLVEDCAAAKGTGDMSDFSAEMLGIEPERSTASWTMISEAIWGGLADELSVIAGTSKKALAVEISEDRTRAWIAVAGYRPDGHYHVEVIEPGYKILAGVEGVDWVERRVMDIIDEDHRQHPGGSIVCVVVDHRRPVTSIIQRLKNADVKVLTPNQPDIAGACGRFYDATGQARADGLVDDTVVVDEHRVFHIGQPQLDRAVRQAVPFELPAGTFVFVRRGAGIEIGPLYAVTLAMHGLVVLGSAPLVDTLDTVDQSRPCSRCGRQVFPEGGVWLHLDDTPACDV